MGRALAVVSGAVLSTPLWAAEHGDTSAVGLAKLGAAIAIGIGATGVATGQGRAASSALEGIARNPTSRGDVFVPMLLALVFMEFQALLCFVIAFLLQS
ncbi:MAG: F0F1 ATP synthase subunit C [Zetaproteobacteria bacterium]|nr:F0F1 ATP synthase subunit C [Pseudobdellovibrionaceae bacterium]